MSCKINIVTGFLGSGKTCLVQNLGTSKWHRGKVGVLIREWLDTAFDGERVVGQDMEVRVVKGQAGDHSLTIDAIRSLLESRRYARLVLEVVDPSDAYFLAKKIVEGELPGLELGKTTTVLDGAAFEYHARNFPEQMTQQIEAADVLLVNKNDVIDDAKRASIRRQIAEVNPDIDPRFTYMSQVVVSSIMDDADEDPPPRLVRLAATMEPLPRFESVVFETPVVCFDRVMFGHKLLNAPARVVRFKGALKCHDRTYGLTGVPGQLDWDPNVSPSDTRIAFIGLGLAGDAESLTGLLEDELHRQMYG